MGVALVNARLFDQTQQLLKETEQRNAELAVINAIQEGMSRSLDFRAIIDLVGAKLADQFGTGDISKDDFPQIPTQSPHVIVGSANDVFYSVTERGFGHAVAVITIGVASCVLAYSGIESVIQTAGLVQSWRDISKAYWFLALTVGVVTPLISAGFKATMPKGANLDPDPEGENEIILGIDESGNYYIDGRGVAKDALEDQLRAKYTNREKDKILYLKADNQLAYGSVQAAIEIARTAGVRVIAAVTDRDGGLFAAEAAKDKKEGK